MFGFSFFELLIVAIVALIVFGPEKLPKVFSEIGKLSGELRKASDSLRREFYNSSYTPADENSVLNKNTQNLKVESNSTLADDTPKLENIPSTKHDHHQS